MAVRYKFGTTAEGEQIDALRIYDASGNSAVILEYGATVQSLVISGPDGPVDVILGYDSVGGYENGNSYSGATCGRVGNRISNARFVIDGQEYRVTDNENGNCLHSGTAGMHAKKWTGELEGETAVMRYRCPDGSAGFPGNLDTEIRFSLVNAALRIEYRAVIDRPCPVNLTNHTYFNLAGEGTILDHELKLDADRYTTPGPGLLPTGGFSDVEGTPFDFRQFKAIGKDIDSDSPEIIAEGGYDQNFCLNGSGFRQVADVICRRSGIGMRIMTDMPGMQIYTGNYIPREKGKGEAVYGKNSGVAFETQNYPDSPNRPEFRDITLRPGEVYSSETVYAFYLLG